MSRTYIGENFDSAGGGSVRVVENGDELYKLEDLYGPDNDVTPNHSPDGFQVGYGGSGPAQLAFALLADAVSLEAAREHYQDFKSEVVANLPDDWELQQHAIRNWV